MAGSQQKIMPLAALGQKTRPLARAGLTHARGAKPGDSHINSPVLTSRTLRPPTVLAITVPLLRNAMAYAWLLVFILALPELSASVMLKGLDTQTLSVVFLPDKARSMADAVVRTIHRLCISRRGLLEWETADAAEQRLTANGWGDARTMWFPTALSATLGVVLPWGSLVFALPFLSGWLLALGFLFDAAVPSID